MKKKTRFNSSFNIFIILVTIFAYIFISNCTDVHDNPYDPANPDSDSIEPPIINNFRSDNINLGFNLSWDLIDSTYLGLAGYNLYRSDSEDQIVSLGPDKFRYTDISYSISDSGTVYSYSIRGVHSSGLEGRASHTIEQELLYIPIDLDVTIRGFINGVPFSEPRDYSDSVGVKIDANITNGEAVDCRTSENPSLLDAEWISFSVQYDFELSDGDGNKTVYMQCRDVAGYLSNTAEDSIILDTSPPNNISIQILPINNTLYNEYYDQITEYTPSLHVQVLLEANDLAQWRAALSNSVANFVDAEYSTLTDNISISKTWVMDDPGGIDVCSVYSRFEDELGHIEYDNIIFDNITYDSGNPQEENCSIIINDGDDVIITNPYDNVTLVISAIDNGPSGIFLMQLGNSSNACTEADWQPYEPEIVNWQLDDLQPFEGYASRSVYIRFRDTAGNIGPTSPSYDDIWLNPPPRSLQNFNAFGSYEQVILTWDVSIENDVIDGGSYLLSRAESGSSFEIIDTLASDINNYTDNNVVNGSLFSYEMIVIDSTGFISDSESIDCTPFNNPPTLMGFSIDPDSVGTRDTEFVFSVTPDVLNDDQTPYDNLNVQWRFKAGTQWTEPSTDKSVIHEFSEDDNTTYDVSLRAIDEDSAISDEFSSTVRINQLPNQPVLQCNPTFSYKQQDITFTAIATDPDEDMLDFYFEYGDGNNSGWTDQNIVPHAYETSGTFSAQVKTSDIWGEESEWSLPPVEITIENRPPDTPQNLSYNPNPLYKNIQITVSATLFDPDQDMVRLCAQWGDGTESCGTPVQNGSLGQVSKQNGYSSSGNYTVDLTSVDEEDIISSSTSMAVEVENRPPNQPALNCDTSGYTCSDIDCDVVVSDPDGDMVQACIDCGTYSDCSDFVNSGSSVAFDPTFYNGGNYCCTAYATDSDGASSQDSNQDCINITQAPPDINNPADITMNYPSSNGASLICNDASGCADNLSISINESCSWLSCSVSDNYLSPAECTNLTCSVTSWTYFNACETKYCTVTINSNDPDEPSKSLSVSATGPTQPESWTESVYGYEYNYIDGQISDGCDCYIPQDYHCVNIGNDNNNSEIPGEARWDFSVPFNPSGDSIHSVNINIWGDFCESNGWGDDSFCEYVDDPWVQNYLCDSSYEAIFYLKSLDGSWIGIEPLDNNNSYWNISINQSLFNEIFPGGYIKPIIWSPFDFDVYEVEVEITYSQECN